MKIGILTQPLHTNYGGLLQNYALQQVLKRNGHQVETIWYQLPKSSKLRRLLGRCKRSTLHLLLPKRFPLLRYTPSDKEIAIIRKNTDAFVNKYITRSEHPICLDILGQYATSKGFNAYIAGSDQCWRPKYNGSALPAMLLDFAKDMKNIKRIAYAASFGTDEWEYPFKMTNICSPLAKKFDSITVREDSGVSLCKEHFDVDATHVLDPTMLLDQEDYIALVEVEKEPLSKGTLFTYILDPNSVKETFISRMAEAKGLTPFTVMPKHQSETRTKDDIRYHLEDCVYPRVTTWLRAFMDAEMTIVDSFHGMVFSIIFNKPFWVIGNEERGMSRFISLLNQFDLKERLLDEKFLQDIDLNKSIDWNTVNTKKEMLKQFSLSLLNNALQE